MVPISCIELGLLLLLPTLLATPTLLWMYPQGLWYAER